MPNASLIVRRETIDQIGILDENPKRFYDDVEWCLRIKKGGWKVYNVPQAQVIHHWYYKWAPDATFLIHTGYFSELYVFKKTLQTMGISVPAFSRSNRSVLSYNENGH